MAPRLSTLPFPPTVDRVPARWHDRHDLIEARTEAALACLSRGQFERSFGSVEDLRREIELMLRGMEDKGEFWFGSVGDRRFDRRDDYWPRTDVVRRVYRKVAFIMSRKWSTQVDGEPSGDGTTVPSLVNNELVVLREQFVSVKAENEQLSSELQHAHSRNAELLAEVEKLRKINDSNERHLRTTNEHILKLMVNVLEIPPAFIDTQHRRGELLSGERTLPTPFNQHLSSWPHTHAYDATAHNLQRTADYADMDQATSKPSVSRQLLEQQSASYQFSIQQLSSSQSFAPPLTSHQILGPSLTSRHFPVQPLTSIVSPAQPLGSSQSLPAPFSSNPSLAPLMNSDHPLALPLTSLESPAPLFSSYQSFTSPFRTSQSDAPPSNSSKSAVPSLDSNQSLAPPLNLSQAIPHSLAVGTRRYKIESASSDEAKPWVEENKS